MVMVSPVPSIVRLSPFATGGRVLVSAIVPLKLKVMVSVALAVTQSPSVVSTPGEFAFLIACGDCQANHQECCRRSAY
jgi:hypothetical protein